MALWKVLRGVHIDKKATLVEARDPKELTGVEREPDDGIFYAGDVIETPVDLARLNTLGTDAKFAKVHESEPKDELAGMTVKDLRDLGEQEGIDLPSNLSKPQIIEAIRGALKYRAAVA